MIARGSSTPYKKTTKTPSQIAAELNAALPPDRDGALAEVRRTGSRVLVTPELVDVSVPDAPTSKWQQPFDASLTDVFGVQSEIAVEGRDASESCWAPEAEKRLAESPTANVAAYDAYLKGEEATTAMARADIPSLRRGLGYYEQAVVLDPKFSEAWGRISTCKALIYTNSVPDPATARGALEAANKAVELAPDKPDGRIALGMYYRVIERDQPRALEEYRKAEKLAPGTPDPLRSIGRAEMQMGRWQDAIGHYEEAERLDPRNAINVGNAAQPLLYLRRCGEARQAVSRSLALAPGNLSRVTQKLQSFLCEGDVAGARALVAETSRRIGPTEAAAYFVNNAMDWLLDAENFAVARRLTPAAFDDDEGSWAYAQAWADWRAGDFTAAREYAQKAVLLMEPQVRSSPQAAGIRGAFGIMLALAGRKDEAIRESTRAAELDSADRSPWTGPEYVLNLAQTYMLVGETDKAIDTLERLLKMPHYMTPAWLAVDPTYDSLRKTRASRSSSRRRKGSEKGTNTSYAERGRESGRALFGTPPADLLHRVAHRSVDSGSTTTLQPLFLGFPRRALFGGEGGAPSGVARLQ